MDGINKNNGKGIPLSPENNALYEFGKKTVTDSIVVLKDYVKLMIPLNTGLITTYFALLKFIGIESASSINNVQLLLSPAICMLLSLVVFVCTIFPLPMNVTIGNIESIIKYREMSWRTKYVGSIIGSIFFILGIVLMICVLAANIQVFDYGASHKIGP